MVMCQLMSSFIRKLEDALKEPEEWDIALFLSVITHEDENGNVKLECPAIGKQQFAAGRFHIDSQRTATKDVDRIVGLDVLRIIKESTATSLAYAFERKNN
ncbi:unnamed protein product [Brassica oleracea]